MTSTSAASAWYAATARYQLDDDYAIDPYLVWAELSDWRGFGDDRPEHVRVLMELAEQPDIGNPEWERIAAIVQSNPLNFPTAQSASSRYVTANVPIADLDKLTEAVRSGLLVRFQLGLARGGAPDDDGKDQIPQGSITSRRSTDPMMAAAAREAVVETDDALQGAAGAHSEFLNTIGIIDDGCCLAHEGFRSAGRTDFLLVWDQNPTERPQLPWTRYSGVSYGEELWNSEIDEVLDRFQERGEPEERRFYTEGLHRPQWGDAGRTHGAGVLHIAWNSRKPEAWGKFLLMFVQLPTDTVADTSGGSLGVYIIDGARYIAQRTRYVADLIEKKGSQCTINISLGSIAGPHDGSTITELALAELGADPKVQIALAAGNTAGKQVHASRRISKGKPGSFAFVVPPDNERESYVEIWLPTDEAVTASHFTIDVLAPNGAGLKSMGVGQAASLRLDERTVASVVFARRMAQGLKGTMILLAIRSTTALDEGGGGAPYGQWSFMVSSTREHEVEVHAWVERNDILIGGRMPQQTRFIDDDSHYVNDKFTLSSIANGPNVTVVGAYGLRQMAVSDYSANGPTLRHAGRGGPDFYGPADRSDSLPGRMLPGFWSGTSTRMSGTSAAAPHVARWMARGRPKDQVCTIHTLDDKGTVTGVALQEPDADD